MNNIFKQKKVIWASIFAVIVAFVVLLLGFNYILQMSASESADIILATTFHPASALIFVAEEKGFFKEEGIVVNRVQFQTGKLALDALLGGGADLATTADVPIALAANSGQKFKVISTIGWSANDIQVVARKDSNINFPVDLKGKRIGTTAGNGPHFFTYSFLKAQGISISDVQILFLLPSAMLPAIERNELDAIIIYEPYLSATQKQLGENAIVFAPNDIYGETWNLVASSEFVKKSPNKAEKFMRALKNAEEYAKTHEGETYQITAKYTSVDLNIVSLTLEDWYIGATSAFVLGDRLLAESSWAVTNGISKADPVHDFNAWIDTSFLDKIN